MKIRLQCSYCLLAAGLLLAASAHAEIKSSASSVHSESYPAAYAFDGDPNTRWASRPTKTDEWLQVDFGRSVTLGDLVIHWERAHPVDYRLELSDDGKAWRTVYHNPSCEGGREEVSTLNGSGRYFRVYTTKYARWGLASIWDLEFVDGEVAAVFEEEQARRRREVREKTRAVAGRLAELGVDEVVFAIRQDGVDDHWYANFGYYAPDVNRKLYRAQGRLCKLNVKSGKLQLLVDDPEGTVRDPAVHYDAERVVFSWRRSGTETFHLYEININGTGLKQLTDGAYDDLEPSYLPDGGIVFVSARAKRWVNCWLSPVAVIYRCDADGGNIRQLSANVEHDNTPWVLPDGRVLYQRWEYVDRSQVHYHHLWTMNPDGTGQMVFFGNMHPGSVFIDAKPIPGSDRVLLIESPGHGRREHAGHVATVTDRYGPDEKSALRRISDNGNCRDPYPLSPDDFLVAEGNRMLHMDSAGHVTELFRIPEPFGDATLHEPRPVIKRARERIIPARADLARQTGRLVVTDVNFGRNMGGVDRGEIKKLLVLETLPKPINYTGGMDPLSYGGTFTLERILGTVPIEADGSAYMELPANRALFFVALDKNNLSVKRMQSFLTVAPGETTSCAGCHEDRAATTDITVSPAGLLALQRGPTRPQPLEGIPEVFDYPRDIQPILDRHCVRCHDYKERKGDVVLTGDRGPMFSHSYVTLTLRREFVDGRNDPRSNLPPRSIGTSASPIMERLDGDHHEVTLSPQEKDMIRYWIESAAPYPGTYAALGGGSIGGYAQNSQVHQDTAWPTADAFRGAVDQRCVACHQRELNLPLPRSLCDELGLSFWRPDWNDERFRFSRHLMFNLTQPKDSLFLLAPLGKEAGGYGICGAQGTDDEAKAVFADTSDPAYTDLLNHIAAGKAYLEEEITRFDMPHFRPPAPYVREMKRYGVLPEAFDPVTDKLDVYGTDRAYWRSLWHTPE